MLDEIVETAIPWGGFFAIGALLGSTFPDETRDLARRAAVTGMKIAERARAVGAESWERAQDILAEARAQHEEERARAASPSPARLTVVDGQPGGPSTRARPRAPRGGSRAGAVPKPAAPRRRRRRPEANPEN
jgi:hypothetical protein